MFDVVFVEADGSEYDRGFAGATAVRIVPRVLGLGCVLEQVDNLAETPKCEREFSLPLFLAARN